MGACLQSGMRRLWFLAVLFCLWPFAAQAITRTPFSLAPEPPQKPSFSLRLEKAVPRQESPSSLVVVRVWPDGRIGLFCGGDPVNGFDSDGRCLEYAGGKIAIGAAQFFLSVSEEEDAQPLDEIYAQKYDANYKYYGNSTWYAINATYNPAVSTELAGGELTTGQGLNYYNSGQTLNDQQMVDSGFNFTTGTASTIGTAVFLEGAGAFSVNAVNSYIDSSIDVSIDTSLPDAGSTPTAPVVAAASAGAGSTLSPSVASSFADGQYQPWVATEDTILYRAESEGQGVGSFFGTEAPADSLDAEVMYNINKWGNNATTLSTYQIPAGTTGFIGPVAGGSGVQIFIPGAPTIPGIQLIDQSSLFSSELKYISSH